MSSELTVERLVVRASASQVPIVDDVSFTIPAGQLLGLVGESGSGKTTIGLALLGYARTGTEITGGTIRIGEHVVDASTAHALRGKVVSYIPQSPASALNPSLRLRTQLLECLPADHPDPQGAMRQALEEVALPTDDEFVSRYPHQISGGQQQRITIAMAFIARPDFIVLDEPTTGLDVTTQRHVLETVRRLVANHGVSAVYISHDVAVVAGLVDRVMVLYSGKVAEHGPNAAVMHAPQHPYTRRLIAAVPDVTGKNRPRGIAGGAPSPFARPNGCAFNPRCDIAVPECSERMPELVTVGEQHEVRCIRAGAPAPQVAATIAPVVAPDAPVILEVEQLVVAYGSNTVLHGVDLALPRGACTALLGESGSGKTTLARAIAGLRPQTSGTVRFDGVELATQVRKRSTEQLRRVQYIFQNPYESINPRRSIADTLLAGYTSLCGKPDDPQAVVEQALQAAALRPDIARRFPDQLSGGERQRVAIARALIVNPEVLICDEITSSLDVSVQASIVELLQELQATRELTLLFVTHNMALVRNIAQHVAVLEFGRIVENAPVASVFERPAAPYTQRLIADTPSFVA